MAITIDEAYIQTYQNNVRHVAQQSNSRLRMCVQEVNVSSEKHNWEKIGTNEATEKTSPRQATPENDTEWTNRTSITSTYDAGDSVEQEDPVQMLVDPNSNITQSMGMAMKRRVDDVIIAAATGTALDKAGASNAFPATQKVGDGTGVLTLSGVTEVFSVFMENDVDIDYRKFMVIGPTQLRLLQLLVQYTSSDYVNVKALAERGFVENWMGFYWIVSNRLLNPAAGEISCLAFTDRAIGLQVNRDATTRVAEDPSTSFLWRIYAYMTMGAVRVEDEHIVHWHLKDAMS